MNNTVTVVSCYYIIPNKHTFQQYEVWIKNFMSLSMYKHIFCDTSSHMYLSNLYPENDTLKYTIKELDDLYVNKWNWKKDELLDLENRPGHNELLYKIWNEKVFFLYDATQLNVYNSNVYIWTDIGSFRQENHMINFTNYPNYNKIVQHKINIFQIKSLDDENYKIYNIDNRFKFKNKIAAGFFGGTIDVILEFKDLYEKMIDAFDQNNLFKGKEQYLYNFIILQNKSLFHIIPVLHYNYIKSNITNTIIRILYDKWFYAHYYWS